MVKDRNPKYRVNRLILGLPRQEVLSGVIRGKTLCLGATGSTFLTATKPLNSVRRPLFIVNRILRDFFQRNSTIYIN